MTKRPIDDSVRDDFKFFRSNPGVTYVNSGTTALKLDSVMETMLDVYQNRQTNRGGASAAGANDIVADINATFEHVAQHMNAPVDDILLTTGTTNGINTIARRIILELEDGDEIFVGEMEHSANIMPWFKIAKELGRKINFRWYPLTEKFEIDYEKLSTMITDKTKFICFAHVFNTVGTKNDAAKVREAVGPNVKLFVDGAQGISHAKIDVKEGDIDYYVFGAHKAFGPYGTGFAYVKNLMEMEEPFTYGGGTDLIYKKEEGGLNVRYHKTRSKFMAGSYDAPGICAFKRVLEYIDEFGVENIEEHAAQLKLYAEEQMKEKLPNCRIINEGLHSPNLFFEVKGVAGEDVGAYLSKNNIAVRAGAVCVKITNGSYQIHKSVRASFHIYNNKQDVDTLIQALVDGGNFIDELFCGDEQGGCKDSFK